MGMFGPSDRSARDSLLSPDDLRHIVVDGTQPLSQGARAALASHGTPLLTDDPGDPERVRALFTCQPGPGDPDGGAHLWVNRLTDKRHTARGRMRRRAAGDLWFAELTVPRDALATYRILPLDAADDEAAEPVPPPRELLRRARIDAGNRLAAAGSPFGSVLAGPDAPSLDAWTAPRPASSIVLDRTIGAARVQVRYRLAVPDGAEPRELLVVFDADAWFDRFRLPDVLAASGRRCAVLGIDSPADPGDRLRFLGGHEALLGALDEHALPATRRVLAAPDRVSIAGQSLGGLAALAVATARPDLVDEVLAYSPSVWWRPGLTSRPADVTERQDWIHDRIASCPPGSFAIRLASGAFEEELTPGVAALADTARAAGHDVSHTVYSGGHDDARWAALLLADL